jgi:tripartite-type tricarboxylate transporter receptor subunit TctC
MNAMLRTGGLFFALTALPMLLVMTGPSAVWAQAYPARPVEIVVPFPPGGTSDQSVRFLADKWSEFLGQPVVVINKPGAGSALGAKLVAGAKPDGYTLFAGTDTPLITVRMTQKDAGYDLDSFTYLFGYGTGGLYFVVKNDARWKTIADFIAEAKRRPGELTYASYGVGVLTHFAAELLWQKSGVKLTYLPYKSSPEAISAMLGGHVDMAVTASTGGIAKGGAARILATAADERRAHAPDVPTLKEQGYPVVLDFISVIVGPRGMANEAVVKLVDAHRKAYAKYKKEIDDGLLKIELVPVAMEGSRAASSLREREKVFRELAPKMGLGK